MASLHAQVLQSRPLHVHLALVRITESVLLLLLHGDESLLRLAVHVGLLALRLWLSIHIILLRCPVVGIVVGIYAHYYYY